MFTREYLKGLELDSDMITKIMTQYGKSVEKNDETIEELTEKLKAFDGVDIEAIKKEQFELGKTEGNKELETFKKNVALEKAVAGSKAKDLKIIQGLLNKESLKFEEKDNEYVISGLDEQIEGLKKTHDYLFEKEDTKAPPTYGGTGDTKTTSSDADLIKSQYNEAIKKRDNGQMSMLIRKASEMGINL